MSELLCSFLVISGMTFCFKFLQVLVIVQGQVSECGFQEKTVAASSCTAKYVSYVHLKEACYSFFGFLNTFEYWHDGI